MRGSGSDRMILVVVPLLALAVGFWFLMVAPKRSESSDLQTRIDSLNSSISAAESQIATAEAARKAFPKNYAKVVTLGRAVPENDDQATFIVDVAGLSNRNEVDFLEFTATESNAEQAAPAPPPAPTPPPADGEGDAVPVEGAAPTEANAATLPAGSTIGPAELPVVGYDFRFLGDFFDMGDFFGDLDSSVRVSNTGAAPMVSGRLTTINSFQLSEAPSGFPKVEASFNVTAYVVPPAQGVQAGATVAGPQPVGGPVPVSAAGGTP